MSRPAWLEFRTARCILWSGGRVLLAMHHSLLPFGGGRWGLPGGRIEYGESAEAAARRELDEELGIALGELIDCGEYRYKSARHKVYGARFDGVIADFDRAEIERIDWFSPRDVDELAQQRRLHAGFEAEALAAFLRAMEAPDR
jgi:8-oxo-dGTP pyrophosphatase MutT (NUDIX family)